jgi:nitroreductase
MPEQSGLQQAADASLQLPKPRREGNALLELLATRRSGRSFAQRELEPQVLANLLWAGFGVSSRDGYRTAPSARNWREIDIYVAMAAGLYRYDAFGATLESVSGGDLRAATGHQDFAATAPVNLVYVADDEKMAGASAKEREFYAAADAGAICENVYLFCASVGLATVARGLIDRPGLERRMRLRPSQRVLLAQTIGYPAR